MSIEQAEDLAHDEFVFEVFAARCPSRATLEHVTGKWGILALSALNDESYRFNALRRKVDGVSEKMLAATLQALERDGFVHREDHRTNPPIVEYSLTDLGKQTARRLKALLKYVEDIMPSVIGAQVAYDDARGV
jgi:DNA-binding HxlR family transcriptional regulator